MTEAERRLLTSLARMCEQYISRDGALDHLCMSAGEGAVALLIEYGLVEPGARGGTWTETGQTFLKSN